MESAKKVFNSNILSQPISTQETTKSKESYRQEAGKEHCNIFQFFLLSHTWLYPKFYTKCIGTYFHRFSQK